MFVRQPNPFIRRQYIVKGLQWQQVLSLNRLFFHAMVYQSKAVLSAECQYRVTLNPIKRCIQCWLYSVKIVFWSGFHSRATLKMIPLDFYM